MVCAVCLFVLLWICDMAGLLRGTFVSWWYLPRIWPSVTDMQHYCHAKYPTDDWHLAYMFSLVYFSVEVCLVGVFPHYVSPLYHGYYQRKNNVRCLFSVYWYLAYCILYICKSMVINIFSLSLSLSLSRRDPCVRVYAPLTLASPLTRKQNSNRGDPALFDPSEGAFELMYIGLPALLGGNLGCWIV